MNWNELKNNKTKLKKAIEEFGLRGLARKFGLHHTTIMHHRDKHNINIDQDTSDIKEGKEEIKPKAEDKGDYYLITSGDRSITLDKEKYKNIKRDYCDEDGNNYLTIPEITRKYKMPRKDFMLIKSAFGFVHNDVQYTDEEIKNNDVDDLVELTLEQKKYKYFEKLKQKEINQAFKELEKYRQKDFLVQQLNESAKEHFEGFADEYTPLKINKQVNTKSDLLLEIPIVDLHYSKLSWEGETGENYDRKIAEDRFIETITDFIARVENKEFEKILFPVGNDYFNFDNPEGSTTMRTMQDNDSRWQKMYHKGNELLIKAIDILAQKAVVDVFVVPGNHDTMTSYHAVHFLNAWYRNIDKVEVSIDPKTRKYRRFGNSLIGFAHLDQEKSRIFGCMQNEAREDWGRTKYHEWHGAHRHSEQVDEKLGVIARNISSITAKDAWHYRKGYQSLAKAQAFIWHKDKGLVNILMHNID